LLVRYGQDFFMSCLADVSSAEFPHKVRTLRVEDTLASEVFTHCYYKWSKDIKTDAEAVVESCGLGLRKKGVRSKNVPGCVFVFVSEPGPSVLLQQRAELSADDRKLSAEERVRRTSMKLDVAGMDHLIAEAKRHPGKFWLTSWTATSVEEAKKKAVCSQIEGQLATQCFTRCLFAEVSNCQDATLRVTGMCGLGMRRSAVRSRVGPGCIAAFFPSGGPPPLPLPEPASTPPSKRPGPGASTSAGTAGPGSSGPKEAPAQPKRRKTGETEPRPAVLLPTRSSPADKAGEAAVASAGGADDEEVYFKQVRVLENRLRVLLPRLDKEDLSTSFVQEKLEEFMQKPHGRLDKFKLDIARIWRSYLEETPAVSNPRLEEVAVECD